MRLVCPSCGAVHSAESWLNDADARQCMILAADLPWDVSRRAFNYLALFRSGDRGLRWGKTLRLLSELAALVKAPEISREKKPNRPGSARIWGLAMDRIIEHPPKRLPLKSHGYLRAIAWEIADDLDNHRERKEIEDQRRPGPPRPVVKNGDPERIDPADMKAIREKNFFKTQ